MLTLMTLLFLPYLGIALCFVRKEARRHYQDRTATYKLRKSQGYYGLKKPSYLRSLVVGSRLALLWPAYVIGWIVTRSGKVLEWVAKKLIGGEDE